MKPYERKSEVVEEWALLVFLLACFLLAFFKDIYPVLDKSLTAAVFASAFFILKQIRDLRIEVRSLDDPPEKHYPSAREFYESAARAVTRSQHQICATYFRNNRPTKDFGKAAEQYFDAVLRFAKEKGTVRRIIKVTNPELAAWCREQEALDRSIPRYYVRVLNPAQGNMEPMNMAIMDKTITYLLFADHTDTQLGGVRPTGKQLAEFLQARFDEHWRLAIPIRDYVESDEFKSLSQSGGNTRRGRP
ncbi:hypothetical protein ACN268_30540 [Micromonospora sp. WMMD735]|uniref:hypothetical protein n=1 Tax=Micromonospora sp. WMMD735 TaxID=3404130 RepID=UPI003B957E45